jgi:hypothetical protein
MENIDGVEYKYSLGSVQFMQNFLSKVSALKAVIYLSVVSLLSLSNSSLIPSGLAQQIFDKPDCSKLKQYVNSKPPPASEPTEVGVGVFFINLLSIDDVNETFTIDGILTLNWKDPRLSKNSLGFSANKCDPSVSEIWSPALQALNRYEATFIRGAVLDINNDGDVVYKQRYKVELYNEFDLKNFPFDQQLLKLALASFSKGGAIKLNYNKDNTNVGANFKRQDWEVGGLKVSLVSDDVKSANQQVPRIDFSFIAKRNSSYYVWNIILPLSLIVLMAWCVFWIDPSQMGPQIGLSTGAVFTLVAYRFTINALLPKISYLTRMDAFLILCTILVFTALGEAILTGHLARVGKEEVATKVDRVFRLLYLVIFAIILVITVT